MVQLTSRSEYRNTGRRESIIKTAQKRLEAEAIRSQSISLAVDKDVNFDEVVGKLEKCNEEYLDGKAVPVIHCRVPVASLEFWPENPRLFEVCGVGPKTQDEVVQALLSKEHEVADLCIKLLRCGGLPDAITVTPSVNGKFKVVEGNRRSAAVMILTGAVEMPSSWPKALRAEIKAKIADQPFPQNVPVKLYKGMTSRQFHGRLAIDHISGKKAWSSLQKAHYAYGLLKERSKMKLEHKEIADLRRLWSELSNADQATLKDVAMECGYSGNKMNELRYQIMAYAANCLYCSHYDTKDQSAKFNFFHRFYKQKYWRDMAEGVQPRLKEEGTKKERDILWPDKDIEQKFMDWLASGKIGECLHVDNLHLVLDNKHSKDVFEKDGYKAAHALWQESSAESDVVFNLARRELELLDKKKISEVENIRKSLNDLKKLIDEKLAQVA